MLWFSLLLFVLPSSPQSLTPISPSQYVYLFNKSVDLLKRCTLLSHDGRVTLFTPDASSSYGAQWTRDFAMAVINAPLSLKATGVNISAAIAYSLSCISSLGVTPDRVQADGKAIPGPGPPGAWPILLAWDNAPFAALMLAAYSKNWPDGDAFFCQWEPKVRVALDLQPLQKGLAYNNPAAPNCSFGFEDTVIMPGRSEFLCVFPSNPFPAR